MTVRLISKQSEHNAAVWAAIQIYDQKDKYVGVIPETKRTRHGMSATLMSSMPRASMPPALGWSK